MQIEVLILEILEKYHGVYIIGEILRPRLSFRLSRGVYSSALAAQKLTAHFYKAQKLLHDQEKAHNNYKHNRNFTPRAYNSIVEIHPPQFRSF